MRRMISAVRAPRTALGLFAINLAAFTLLRLAFLLLFRDHPIAAGDLLRAFDLGLKFDARLAAIVSAPLLFFSSRAYVAIVEALLAVLYTADFATYAYIHQRLNAGVLEFLRNPIISWHMVWESYHVVWFGLAIVALGVVAGFLTGRFRNRPLHKTSLFFMLFLVACIYGKFSRYPLRWSDAFFSRDAFIGELALNPAQFLFETMRERPASF